MKKLNVRIVKFLTSQFYKSRISPHAKVYVENLIAKVRRKKVRFHYEGGMSFKAIEGKQFRVFKEFERGIWLYRNGLRNRAEFLFKSYCLNLVEFISDDIVIDCGANSGDLYLKFCDMIQPNNYIAFEPNPTDFEVLKENLNSDCRTCNQALGNVDTMLDFYVASKSGDSSIVEPSVYDEKITVQVTRLDTYMVENAISEVKLLKIEAEGFEPEILEGASGCLDRILYIAVDGGFERGIDQKETFTNVTNYLTQNGFEMVGVYFPWHRALYKNTKN